MYYLKVLLKKMMINVLYFELNKFIYFLYLYDDNLVDDTVLKCER